MVESGDPQPAVGGLQEQATEDGQGERAGRTRAAQATASVNTALSIRNSMPPKLATATDNAADQQVRPPLGEIGRSGRTAAR